MIGRKIKSKSHANVTLMSFLLKKMMLIMVQKLIKYSSNTNISSLFSSDHSRFPFGLFTRKLTQSPTRIRIRGFT